VLDAGMISSAQAIEQVIEWAKDFGHDEAI
jgi:ferritin-like metal-binding protein YciE